MKCVVKYNFKLFLKQKNLNMNSSDAIDFGGIIAMNSSFMSQLLQNRNLPAPTPGPSAVPVSAPIPSHAPIPGPRLTPNKRSYKQS